MRKIREILRLKEAGLSNRAIARACKISNSTVGEYLRRARAAGLHWPLPEGLHEDELYQKLFPQTSESIRGFPDAGTRENQGTGDKMSCSPLRARSEGIVFQRPHFPQRFNRPPPPSIPQILVVPEPTKDQRESASIRVPYPKNPS